MGILFVSLVAMPMALCTAACGEPESDQAPAASDESAATADEGCAEAPELPRQGEVGVAALWPFWSSWYTVHRLNTVRSADGKIAGTETTAEMRIQDTTFRSLGLPTWDRQYRRTCTRYFVMEADCVTRKYLPGIRKGTEPNIEAYSAKEGYIVSSSTYGSDLSIVRLDGSESPLVSFDPDKGGPGTFNKGTAVPSPDGKAIALYEVTRPKDESGATRNWTFGVRLLSPSADAIAPPFSVTVPVEGTGWRSFNDGKWASDDEFVFGLNSSPYAINRAGVVRQVPPSSH
jgi:hypothetical protein